MFGTVSADFSTIFFKNQSQCCILVSSQGSKVDLYMAIYHLSETVLQFSQDWGSCCTPNKSQDFRENMMEVFVIQDHKEMVYPMLPKRVHFPTESAATNALISLYTVHMYIAYCIYICIVTVNAMFSCSISRCANPRTSDLFQNERCRIIDYIANSYLIRR